MSSNSTHTSLIDSCESDLRRGFPAKAAARLRSLSLVEIPTDTRLRLANLCRRSDLIELSMKILTPVVHAKNEGVNPSPKELAEYAAGLLRLGAVPEAMDILTKVDPTTVPMAHLYRAIGYVKTWNHEEAIPCFEEFIKHSPTEYLNLFARVNYAVSLAALGRMSDASMIIDAVINNTVVRNHRRLMATCRDVRAQILLSKNDFSGAMLELDSAEKEADLKNTVEGTNIRKWRAIVQSAQTQSVTSLDLFRDEVMRRGHFEALRDIDFYELKLRFTDEVFARLICGTPFPAFRERVQKEFGRHWTADGFRLGKREAPYYNLRTSAVEGRNIPSPGTKIHSLMAALLSDLYRPMSLGALFAHVFPNEQFNIFSSPNRVHQLIWRCRDWLAHNGIPVTLEETKGHYRMRIHGDFGFYLSSQRAPSNKLELEFGKLAAHFPKDTPFSSRDAQAKLGISSTSFKRLAQWGIDNNRLKRIGASRATVYQIAD